MVGYLEEVVFRNTRRAQQSGEQQHERGRLRHDGAKFGEVLHLGSAAVDVRIAERAARAVLEIAVADQRRGIDFELADLLAVDAAAAPARGAFADRTEDDRRAVGDRKLPAVVADRERAGGIAGDVVGGGDQRAGRPASWRLLTWIHQSPAAGS